MADDVVHLLTVCTFNQTRSVALEALVHGHLDRLHIEHRTTSAGVAANGRPPLPPTIAALAARGHDVRQHRGARLDEAAVAAADIILCAERDHVIRIVGHWPETWPKVWTAPEFVDAARRHIAGGGAGNGRRADERAGTTIARHLAVMASERTRAQFLNGSVAEIFDPTGHSPRVFESAIDEMDAMAAAVAQTLDTWLAAR
jgi:protein-tyrosine phosphatase